MKCLLAIGLLLLLTASTAQAAEEAAGFDITVQPFLISTPAPGLYRIRIQLSALPSFKGRVPHLSRGIRD